MSMQQVLPFFIPIIALSIPLAGVIFVGLQKLARTRLEEARVRSGELGAGVEAELTALREEVGDLRRELGELHERIDFTERLLTQAREKDRLPPGREQS
jgi:phage shock protein A